MAIKTEMMFYESIKQELLAHHQGKFVLIIGNEQLGIFDSGEDAFRRGVELKGDVPMLIRKLEEDKPAELVSERILRLINPYHPKA